MKNLQIFKTKLNDDGIDVSFNNNVLFFYKLSSSRKVVFMEKNLIEVFTLKGGSSGGFFKGNLIKETTPINDGDVICPEPFFPFISGSQTLAIVNKDAVINIKLPFNSEDNSNNLYRLIHDDLHKAFTLDLLLICQIQNAAKIIELSDKENKNEEQINDMINNSGTCISVMSDIKEIIKEIIEIKDGKPLPYKEIQERISNARAECEKKLKALGLSITSYEPNYSFLEDALLTDKQRIENQLFIRESTSEIEKQLDDKNTEVEVNKQRNKGSLEEQANELQNRIKEMDAESQAKIIDILPPSVLLRQGIAKDPNLFFELVKICTRNGSILNSDQSDGILKALDSLEELSQKTPKQITSNGVREGIQYDDI